MRRRYAWRDDQWEKIESLLPGREDTVGDGERQPGRFGDFRVVHTRPTRWSTRAVWKRVFERLADEPDTEYAMIDSTIVRAHQHSTGAKGGIRRRKPLGAAQAD